MVNVETYQWRLRALGAFLDTQSAADVSSVETTRGFAVRYYRRRAEREEPIFVMIEMPQLRAISEALRGRRQGASDPDDQRGQHPGQITADDRYQDLFRALGWELDDLQARNIVIDERVDGLYLSYLYEDPTSGSVITKRVANLGVPEWEAILHDARRRRGRGTP